MMNKMPLRLTTLHLAQRGFIDDEIFMRTISFQFLYSMPRGLVRHLHAEIPIILALANLV